jgi:hypothetical protein
MNLQKLLMLALLAAAVSATTAPTLGKVLGFGHSVAFAANDDSQGDNDGQGEDDVMGNQDGQ